MARKMYRCKNCGYVQDFSPKNKEKMRTIFRKEFPDPKNKIKINQCPSCRKEKAF